MNKTFSICATAALAALGTGAQAQEITGRVLSSTPVVQQVQVPRQICDNQPVAVQQPKSGAGAAIGAIAGGAMGNAIGGGSGRAAATVLGLVGGAIVGDRVEGGPVSVQNMQRCTTQTFYENRTVGYNVMYEYAGRQYTAQLPNDPGHLPARPAVFRERSGLDHPSAGVARGRDEFRPRFRQLSAREQ